MSIVGKRLNKVKPSPTLAIAKKASELKASGVNIIDLALGEPDFDTPDNVKEAAIAGIRAGKTKYTAVDGMPELKRAIIAKLEKENELTYNPKQIIVGTGAKQVIYNALVASLDIGDEVIIPAPYWVSYPDMVALAGGDTVYVECNGLSNFKLTANQLKKVITKKTKWVILNSPSNPTGSAYSYNEMKALTDVLLDYPNIYILSDDIYEHITYDDFKFVTPAQVEPKLYDRTLLVNGVSKSYAMTGWRIGYGAGPEELIKAMSIVQSQSTSSPSTISQIAAIEALVGPQDFITNNKAVFQKRRDLVINALNEIDLLKCNRPEGAFYLFPECKKMFGKKTPEGKILQNSSDVVEYFLSEAKVSTVHGSAFGIEGFFRISYATSEALLTEACNRIKDACAKLI